MKLLRCEMCGSSDLVKQNGVFECQSCGCKYSVEEARKMMVEGSVDVSGSTVKVDNSAKIQNLYTLARRARDDGNAGDAARYYREIILEDPNSWEAAFYGVYFGALNCTVGQIEQAASSISNSVASVCNLIKTYVPAEEQKQAYTECLHRVVNASEILCSAAQKALENTGVLKAKDPVYDPVQRMFVAPPITETERSIKRDFVGRAKACDLMLVAAGDAAETVFEDYNLAKAIYSKGEEICQARVQFLGWQIGTLYVEASAELQQVFQKKIYRMEPKMYAAKQKRIEIYWEAHSEEKQRYEAMLAEYNREDGHLKQEIARCDTRIGEIKKELVKPLPEEDQWNVLRKQKYERIEQKARAGIFAGKQKKALQEQIDELQRQMDELDEMADKKKKGIREDIYNRIAEVEKERKAMKARLDVLTKEIADIQEELTKDR